MTCKIALRIYTINILYNCLMQNFDKEIDKVKRR